MYRILSFNILCAGKEHRIWQNRVPLVCEIIKEYKPSSFGVQEAHWEWMEKLIENLPEYDYVGVGREDGKKDRPPSEAWTKKDRHRLRCTYNERRQPPLRQRRAESIRVFYQDREDADV